MFHIVCHFVDLEPNLLPKYYVLLDVKHAWDVRSRRFSTAHKLSKCNMAEWFAIHVAVFTIWGAEPLDRHFRTLQSLIASFLQGTVRHTINSRHWNRFVQRMGWKEDRVWNQHESKKPSSQCPRTKWLGFGYLFWIQLTDQCSLTITFSNN